jgi:hypothetical protein
MHFGLQLIIFPRRLVPVWVLCLVGKLYWYFSQGVAQPEAGADTEHRKTSFLFLSIFAHLHSCVNNRVAVVAPRLVHGRERTSSARYLNCALVYLYLECM